VLCAAGFNIRWLLRAIAAKGLAALLLGHLQLTLYAARIGRLLQTPTFATERLDRRLDCHHHRVTPRLIRA